MYKVIRRIVDDGVYFDIKPRWARTIITCLARIGGRPVGIVANQPKHLGGILDNDSADKAARFIKLCDAFNIPLRVPPGRARLHGRHQGRARRDHPPRRQDALRGRRRHRAEDHRGVRKAYGAGYYVMCGRAYEPDLIVAWPTAEISRDGRRGRGQHHRPHAVIEAADDPDATRKQMEDAIRATIDPYIAAGNAMIDDVIDPRETRPIVIRRSRWRRPSRSSGRGRRWAWCRYEGRAGRRAGRPGRGRGRGGRRAGGRRPGARRRAGGGRVVPRPAAVARRVPAQAGPAVLARDRGGGRRARRARGVGLRARRPRDGDDDARRLRRRGGRASRS